MRIALLILSIFLTGITLSQSEDFPDQDTEFPGGAAEMKKFIAAEVQYPDIALLNRDQGRVYVQFIVEKNGELSNIRIHGGVTPELDAEAIRIISEMPRWIPAKLNGENIRVNCRLPITFSVDARTSRRARRELRQRMK